MRNLRVHHIGLVVYDMENSIELYKNLGYICSSDVIVDVSQSNRIVFLNSPDEMQTIELVEAMTDASTVVNFKPGYHHVCYDVSSIPNFVECFKALRVGKIFTQPMIAPAINHKEVVFALLRNGLFVEFILT